MWPLILALWILSGLAIALGVHLRYRICKEHYLAGRIDQQQWERLTMGGTMEPIQVFTQQIAERGIALDLHRLNLPEWDGHDRLSDN